MEKDFFDITEEPVNFEFELKRLALNARLDMEFYRLIVYSPSVYDTMINLFPWNKFLPRSREPIGIADDFARFFRKTIRNLGC